MGSSKPASIHLTRLVDPSTYYSLPPTTSLDTMRPFTSDITVHIKSNKADTTFWASSPRPYGSTTAFALATSAGTRLVAEDQTGWLFESQMPFLHAMRIERDSEVVAVDWLDTNTIANGFRDGGIRFWDVRSQSPASTSFPVQHPSAIAHVRKLNANTILVAGIESALCSYDLRYLKAGPINRQATVSITEPYVSFASYRNKDKLGTAIGCDVYADLVAVGTDTHKVQVFDGATGREIEVGGVSKGAMGEPVRCLRFVGGDKSVEAPKLLISRPFWIEEWSW